MKIILLMTGDELLSGNIVDTNAAWIADQCWMLGHQVIRKITVGDDADAIGAACRAAAAHADAVIVSGGLGATTDDITVESAAKAFGVPRVLDGAAWQGIQDFFKSRGLTCTENNKRQAMLPTGATALSNIVGTAPGVQWGVGKTTFFFLPGVPRELKQLFSDHIYPWLKTRATEIYAEHRLQCVGMPEATIGQTIQAIDLGDIRLSYRAHFPEVMLKVIARGPQAEAHVATAIARIRQALGTVVYGEGNDTLSQVVGRMLIERGETVAVAESCTGGYISNQITNTPGASAYFNRGAVTYSNAAKEQWLAVPPYIIDTNGAVSAECAEFMATGIQKVAGTTYGLSVTGIAGPEGGTPEKPVGTVFVGLAHPKGIDVSKHFYPQGREVFKVGVSAAVLNTLRLHLLRTHGH